MILVVFLDLVVTFLDIRKSVHVLATYLALIFVVARLGFKPMIVCGG